MTKIVWVFLATGLMAVACGDDGETVGEPAPPTAGAGGSDAAEPSAGAGAGSDAGGTPADGGPVGGGGGAGGNPAPVTPEGGSSGAGGDENMVSAGGWETVHGDPPLDPDCGDYSEHRDLANPGGELTALSYATNELTICGRIDAYHYEPETEVSLGTVDIDQFKLKVLEAADYVVSLEILGDGAPDTVQLDVGAGFSGGGADLVVNKRAAAFVHLYDAGFTTIQVNAYGTNAIAQSVPYKLHIRKDSPVSRCPAVLPANATQKYSEAHDGAANNGNDVIHYDYNLATQIPTASASDAPEASGIVLGNGSHSLIQGTSALVDYGDDYDDGDMFAFKTGASEVVTMRLDWAGNKTDLDLMLFEENDFQYIAAPGSYNFTGPELFTVLLKPNTTYWAYVAGASSSKAGGLPLAYSVTLCGEAFKF